MTAELVSIPESALKAAAKPGPCGRVLCATVLVKTPLSARRGVNWSINVATRRKESFMFDGVVIHELREPSEGVNHG